MKNFFVCFLTLFGWSVFFPLSSSGVIIDRIVAIVNDEVITQSEIEEVESSLIGDMLKTGKYKDKNALDRKEIKNNILEKLIEKKVQLQEAVTLGITATDENVNRAIKEIKTQNEIINQRQLEEALLAQGMTLEDLRRQISDRIKVTKLINRKVRSKVQVGEDEIRSYYRKHQAEFNLKEEVHARHILLKVPENASSEAEQKIRENMEKIALQLEGGADFAEAARKFSQAPDAQKGGDLGYFKKGQMIPEFDRAVFSLQPGQRSPVIRTPLGFHIMEALDRKKHTIDNDPKLRKEIEKRIIGKKTDQQLIKFMKELKKKAFINILKKS